MSFLPKKNYKYNREIPLPAGLIHGQSLGAVSGMKFGLSNMSLSGCEVIAVYNALLLCGRSADFSKIAYYMERFRVLFGFWGTNFLSLGHCLKHFGLHARRVRKREKIEAALESGRTVVYVYWCGKRFRSSVHTVVLQKHGDEIRICNAYNQCGHIFRTPYSGFLASKRTLFGYIIEPDAA
ncbi:MAG: hypothetical protein MJ065_01935 [Oscillospiraceae bacterium]|nr:hypothetical protein [Oscillospiraceae bacterium]